MKKFKKQLDLRKLSASDRDAVVLIALCEVLGWRWFEPRWPSEARALIQPGYKHHEDWKLTKKKSTSIKYVGFFPVPPLYTASADAVIPLLNQMDIWWTISDRKGPGRKEYITIIYRAKLPDAVGGHAETFPLSACYALLLAAGVEVLT